MLFHKHSFLRCHFAILMFAILVNDMNEKIKTAFLCVLHPVFTNQASDPNINSRRQQSAEVEARSSKPRQQDTCFASVV